uniref:Uncharacterized protein n=1 Tax=Trichuris muris TaxID=70415 RepID=A0A5S6QG66_TRIMR
MVDSKPTQCHHAIFGNVNNTWQEKAQEKSFLRAVITMQAIVRSFLTRKHLCSDSRAEFFDVFPAYPHFAKPLPLPDALSVFPVVRRVILFRLHEQDGELFTCLCQYLLVSYEAKELKKNFCVLAASTCTVLSWLWVMKKVLCHCVVCLEKLRVSTAYVNSWAVLKVNGISNEMTYSYYLSPVSCFWPDCFISYVAKYQMQNVCMHHYRL